jgi:hypothetical protein
VKARWPRNTTEAAVEIDEQPEKTSESIGLRFHACSNVSDQRDSPSAKQRRGEEVEIKMGSIKVDFYTDHFKRGRNQNGFNR